jgi:hypothetical protein
MSDVWTWIKSINSNKINLLEDEYDIKQYQPYVVNKSLSYHWDTVMLSNEMNLYSSVPLESQYLFYLHSIRKGNRYSRWVKKESSDNLELVKKYYNCNDARAYEIIDLLSKEQINYIKNKLENCGLKK